MKARKNRTGLELVKEWAAGFPTRAAAAEQIVDSEGNSLATSHFVVWLNVPDRGIRPNWAQAIALAADLPIEAILFKNTPLRELPCERARAKGRAA